MPPCLHHGSLALLVLAAVLSGCPKASIKARSSNRSSTVAAQVAGTIDPTAQSGLSTRDAAINVPPGAFGDARVSLEIVPLRTAPELPRDAILLNSPVTFDAKDATGKAVLLAVRPIEATLNLNDVVADTQNVYVLVQTSDGQQIAIPPELLRYENAGAGPTMTFKTFFTDAIYVVVRAEASAVATYRDYRLAAVDIGLAAGTGLTASAVAFEGAARAYVDGALDERRFDADGELLVAWRERRSAPGGFVVLAFAASGCSGSLVAQSLAKSSPASLSIAAELAAWVQVATLDESGAVVASGCSEQAIVVDRTAPVPPVVTATVPEIAAHPSDASIAIATFAPASFGTDAASGGVTHEIVVFADAACGGAELRRAAVDSTSGRAEAHLAKDGVYSFRIEAVDAAGNIAVSSCSTAFVATVVGVGGAGTSSVTGSGDAGGGGVQPAVDQTPPPALLNLVGATSATTHGVIDLSWAYPVTTDYQRLVVRRVAGSLPPAADCASGVVVADLASFASTGVADQTGADFGESFSYRFCVTDAGGNLESSGILANLQALDAEDPLALASFVVASGASHGTIDLNMSFDPAATPDYANLEIRRLAGASAPLATCTDGDIAFTSAGPFTDPLTHSDTTGSAIGAPFSYRACIRDDGGRLTSSQTVVNVATRDLVAPNPPVTFSAVPGAGAGEVDLVLDFGDVADYASVSIRRKTGALPAANCVGGGETAVKTYGIGQFLDDAFTDVTGIPGGTFGFRLCIFDASNNLNADLEATVITSGGGGGTHYKIFTTAVSHPVTSLQTGGPDALCQAEAITAGLAAGNFMALVTWAGVGPKSKFLGERADGELPFRLVDGTTVVAGSLDSLFSMSHSHAIDKDAQGVLVTGLVWTGTATNGAPADNCFDYASSNSFDNSWLGNAGNSNGTWIMNNLSACDGSHRLYCMSRESF